MEMLLLLVMALIVIVLTEWVKKYVTWRPEAIAALFTVVAITGQAAQGGQPPDIPALVNGLYIYMTASLGYDKGVQPMLKALRRE